VSAMNSGFPEPQEGERQIGQYILEEKLGEGGMAEVWKARNQVLGTPAAIKFLNQSFAGHPETEQRFLGEGKRQAQLRHPNIVSAFDFIYLNGRSYLIMEYIEGEGLDTRLLKLQAPMPLADVITVSRDVLGALGYAHAHNVVHRDVKPSNILLENGGRVYVMDFGIALVTGEQRLTRIDMCVGTPHYMSPEQIVSARNIDCRSDIYAYGCVLYEMLTNHVPFDVPGYDGDTGYLIKDMHLRQAPMPLRQLNPAIPEHVNRAVLRCLEKKPADRFNICEELLQAISRPAERITVVETRLPTVVEPIGPVAVPDTPLPQLVPLAPRQTPLTPAPSNKLEAQVSTSDSAQIPTPPARSLTMLWVTLGVFVVALLSFGGYYVSTHPKKAVVPPPVINPELPAPAKKEPTPVILPPDNHPSGPTKKPPITKPSAGIPDNPQTEQPPQTKPEIHTVTPPVNNHPSPTTTTGVPGHELSGHWDGDFRNINGHQNTNITMDITEGNSDTLTGTLTFNLASGSSGSCALTGLYDPDRHFMVLDVAHCQGNTPHHLQGHFGFNAVKPTDRRVTGVDPVHNCLIDLNKN
jgi:serine/threonine protein kinase